MRHLRSRALALPLVILAWCLAADSGIAAQAGNGTLAGTVVDAQGASVPGALVAVTEQATGAVRSLPSDHEGVFRFPALPPGRYRVEVTIDGFAPLNLTDVPLAPAEVKDLGKVSL